MLKLAVEMPLQGCWTHFTYAVVTKIVVLQENRTGNQETARHTFTRCSLPIKSRGIVVSAHHSFVMSTVMSPVYIVLYAEKG